MRSWRHYGIGLIGLIFGLSLAWQPWPALAGPAPSPGKPALYDFGRGMCIPCKEMEKVLTDIKGEYSDQVEVRLVMMEKNEDLFNQYKLMLVPTQVFLNAEGKEVDRHIGAWSKDQVVKKLKELQFIQ